MREKEVFISLGSNLGNRPENLRNALQAIEVKLGRITRKSSVYETKPWGKSDQPDFLNQVILILSDKSPEECLNELSKIEKELGRNRVEKWGARIIDLDLLYLNDFIINTEKLVLPHSGIPQRRFVLVPLVEIAPDFIHPQLHKTQKQLLDDCPDLLDVIALKA